MSEYILEVQGRFIVIDENDHRRPSAIFELVRSDTGDGGWSLHDPDPTNPDGWAPLHRGPAGWNERTETWDRPNENDILVALAQNF